MDLGAILGAAAPVAAGALGGPWAALATGALVGSMNAEKKAEQQRKHNLMQAELTRYSPWTGMRGQISPVDADPMEGALTGGFSGLAMSQALGQKGMFAEKASTPIADSVGQAAPTAGYGASTMEGKIQTAIPVEEIKAPVIAPGQEAASSMAINKPNWGNGPMSNRISSLGKSYQYRAWE